MRGTFVEDDQVNNWSIANFSCAPLSPGQAPPPEGLVANFHRDLVDGEGRPVPVEVLRNHDLNKGLSDVLTRTWG